MTHTDVVILNQCDALAKEAWTLRRQVLIEEDVSDIVRSRVAGALKAICEELGQIKAV